MKKASILSALSIFLILMLGLSTLSHAQLRKDLNSSYDLMGPIVKEENPSKGANLGNLFNMQMSHSYSVNFASFGGQVQNMNAYTNTMHFFFNEDRKGRSSGTALSVRQQFYVQRQFRNGHAVSGT